MPGVYLIFRNQIFSDAVRAILETRPEIKLIGVSNRPERLTADLAALAPDVILLEGTEDGSVISDIRDFLASPLPCRFITLWLNRDGMHVWSQTWYQTVGPQDLVEAIITAGEG